MSLKTYKATIDGCGVVTTSFGGRDGVRIGRKLLAVVLPLLEGLDLSSMMPTKSEDSEDSEPAQTADLLKLKIDPKLILKMVGQIIADESLDSLLLELVSTTFVDNRDLSNVSNFDDVFADNLGLLFKIVKHVVVSNFSSIFGTLLTSSQKK